MKLTKQKNNNKITAPKSMIFNRWAYKFNASSELTEIDKLHVYSTVCPKKMRRRREGTEEKWGDADKVSDPE